MHEIRLTLFLMAASAVAGAAQADSRLSACEAAPAVRRAIADAYGDTPTVISGPAERERRAKAAATLRGQHPDDAGVQLLYWTTHRDAGLETLEGQLSAASAAQEKSPNDVQLLYLRAMLLRDSKPRESLDLLSRAAALSPDAPPIMLAMATAYSRGPTAAPRDFAAQVRAYVARCPDTVGVYNLLGTSKDRELVDELMPKFANAVRGRPADADACPAYGSLWNQLFRSADTAAHAALRDGIAADLARLRDRPDIAASTRCLKVLKSGFELTGDDAGKRWAEDRMIALAPTAESSIQLAVARWRETHPMPGDFAQRDAHHLEFHAFLESQLQAAPESVYLLQSRFYNAAATNKLPEADTERAIDAYLQAYANSTMVMLSTPSTHLFAADILLRRKINIERVPAMVADGVRIEAARRAKMIAANTNAAFLKQVESAGRMDAYYAAKVLTDYQLQRGDLARAGKQLAAMARELDALTAKQKPDGDSDAQRNIRFRADYLQRRAELAGAKQRDDDALADYRSAWSLFAPGEGEAMRYRQLAETYWKERGRDAAGFEPWLLAGAKAAGSKPSRTIPGWTTLDRKLPDFSIKDAAGKTWRVADLKGRKVFINFWATWCAPCIEELPHVQAMHERLKGRKDAMVVTINADFNIGLVEPFMKKKGYTFTVLPTGTVNNTAFGDLSGIPRNWLVGDAARIEHERVGFGGDGSGLSRDVLKFLGEAAPGT